MANLRLLLAEEDEHTRTFLADNLTADGYHVDVVQDRNQAVARLRTTTPDVIVADVNGTTLALLDWLRGADGALCAAAPDTPVIVLTSRSEEVHWVRLLERGGDDVIAKPFSYPELRARIAAAAPNHAAPGPAGAERRAGADQSAGPPRHRRRADSGALRGGVPAALPAGRRGHSRVHKD